MRKMDIGIGVVVIILLAIGIMIATEPNGQIINKPQKETVKIGVSLPLTGGGAFMGEGMRNAILLAKEQLPQTQYNYEVIFEDDKLSAKEANLAINKLINIDNVDAVISISSATGNAISPITEQNKIVHIGIASDAAVANGEFNFIHWTPPEEEARLMVDELQRRNIESIGIIRLNHDGAKAIVDAFLQEVKKTDIDVVADEIFNPEERDFRTPLLKIKEAEPEIYFLLAFSPEIELIRKQMLELNINDPITAIEAFEFTEEPEIFEGHWYIQAADPTGSFIEVYRSKYDDDPTIGSANAFDAFNLIVQTFEQTDSADEKPTTTQIAQKLSELTQYSGALGTLKVLDEGIIHSKAVVREVRGGEFVTIRKG